MHILIAIAFWAFGFSLEAAAAKKAQTALECEFFLTDPRDSAYIQKWLSTALSAVRTQAKVFPGNFPRAAAFRELGLPQPLPRSMSMKVEPAAFEKDLYWLRILRRDGSELANFPFHFPPVAVWKHVEGWDEQTELELELERRISPEDAKVLSAGTLLGDFAGGRKFIVIRRRIASLVTVAIGLDMEMERFRAYSNAPEPAVVAIDENKLWARVEVIKAHFTIPSWPGREEPVQ